MISQVRPSFWRAYEQLAPSVKARARQAYQIFADHLEHPSLRFKKLQGGGDIWSVRINEQYCAVGVLSGDTIQWIWIGTHNEFDNFFS